MTSFRLIYQCILIIFLLSGGCTSKKNEGQYDVFSNENNIFHVGKNIISERINSIMRNSAEDFFLVRNGWKPKHSKIKSALLDGGTETYEGDGYILEVKKTAVNFGGISGYFYGPIIHFSEPSLQIKESISDVRFFSAEELRKILKN